MKRDAFTRLKSSIFFLTEKRIILKIYSSYIKRINVKKTVDDDLNRDKA